MTPLVSVITPTIPSRGDLLLECMASVKAQTTAHPWEHLIRLDDKGEGNSRTVNRIAAEARGEWYLPLADDDLLCPGALEILLAHAGGADIVWSRPLVWGNPSPHLTQGVPPYIPSFALVARELWHQLGGYDEGVRREEDRGMWRLALEAGAVFRFVEQGPTWIYRFHGHGSGHQNKSYHGGTAT